MGFMGDFFMGTEGTPGEHGIDVAYLDDYGDYEGMRDQMNDYWSGAMNFQESDAMKNFSSGILDEQYGALDRNYLGDPGNRGNSAMGLAGQIGAQAGLGPKATVAQQGKVNYELQAKKAAAKAAMDKYRMEYMGQSAMRAPEGMSRLPQGQKTATSSYNVAPTEGQPGWLKEQFGNLMSYAGVPSPTDVADIAGTFFRGKQGTGTGADVTSGSSGYTPMNSSNVDFSQYGY